MLAKFESRGEKHLEEISFTCFAEQLACSEYRLLTDSDQSLRLGLCLSWKNVWTLSEPLLTWDLFCLIKWCVKINKYQTKQSRLFFIGNLRGSYSGENSYGLLNLAKHCWIVYFDYLYTKKCIYFFKPSVGRTLSDFIFIPVLPTYKSYVVG